MRALLVALMLTVAVPAAINAADRTSPHTSPATTTPLDQNLLKNAGFEQVGVSPVIPKWTVTGDVHVETFGTRAWPTPAYALRWDGGKRYLACGTAAGAVRQTVDFTGWGTRTFQLQARLAANFGGTLGHQIRVSIRMTSDANQQASKQKLKVVEITNSYRKAVTTLVVPIWATHIEASVQLMPKVGAPKCKVVADSIDLWVFKP